MGDFLFVGKNVPRIDAEAKVKGEAVYCDDIEMPDMLCGKVKRSPYPHAKIISIDTSKAEALEGVEAVVAGRDLPDLRYGLGVWDCPVFARDRVRYIGEPVVGVAAKDEETAQRAIDLIEVKYEELPAIFDPEEAMKPDCPVVIHPDFWKYKIVWPGGCSPTLTKALEIPNITNYFRVRIGDVEKGFKESDLIVENDYTYQWVHPSELEPHCSIAKVDPATGDVTVWTSSQCPYMVRTEICDGLGLSPSKIRIIVPYVGGGFGNKLEMVTESMCVALAQRTGGKPVKLRWSREEMFTITAQPAIIHIKDGVKKDGTLVAREMKVIMNMGAYAGWTQLKVKNAMYGGIGNYKIPNFKWDSYGVYTNSPVTACLRGYAARQPVFAIECQMDIIAKELGMDPIELRLKNSLEEGDRNIIGEKLTSVGAKACLKAIAEEMKKWGALKRVDGSIRRGRGVAIGNKYSLLPIADSAIVKVHEDGTVEVRTSGIDMGQGYYTLAAMVAAEEFKLPLEKVKVVMADTAITPFGFGASSNSQTQACGVAIREACRDAKMQIFKKAGEKLDVKADELDMENGKIYVKNDPSKSMMIGDLFAYMPLAGTFYEEGEILGKATAYWKPAPMDPETGKCERAANYYGYSAQAVEVEVDVETGEVKVVKLVNALDCGRPILPFAVEGQAEGCASMNLGFGLFEEIYLDKGKVLNPNFTDYKIPTILDHPSVEYYKAILVEAPHEPERVWGAKGVGEAANTVGAPAVANAIADALGIRIHDLAITPQKILRALKAGGR
ncbi:xanthine dehydrogenase family protein molybdopterin-binding subunit [Candidatus Hecatella orcuttiae]|jgi:carbon-monoxide dehydrogenase large subunit|uniref:xanthine dehydrogenase family protein molybdopterin-binding subunit n=1 Tax=Candidatus Hecatella orcuttiae TaxID=1935119 RepID=UPI002867B458|nr:xanthine dehydrogenase family protein molybdopterin-binding subunit [Candidatus Hecatella orcuttiae]